MERKLNILLITGIVTDEHDPKMNPMIRYMLESTGRFRVKITEEFTGATAETLEKYDAVFINYDGKEDVDTPFVGWGANAEKVLYDYVKGGGGAVVYHSSFIHGEPAFPDEYDRLVGCRFSFFEGGRKSPKLEMIVNIDTEAHEITKGSKKFWMAQMEDFFVNMKWLPDVPVNVLATVRDSLEDYTDPSRIQEHVKVLYKDVDLASLEGMNTDVPVAWTHNFGKGRVFTVSIGHGIETLRRADFVGMMCRATEWVASGEITISYPDLQNEKRTNCWPYYKDLSVREYAAMTAF